MPDFTPIAVGVLLAAVFAAIVGDATGCIRCEQHYLGVELEMALIADKIAAYEAEHGVRPKALDELTFTEGVVPRDYWRRDFLYDGDRLTSLGRDGEPGGIGEDADVTLAL